MNVRIPVKVRDHAALARIIRAADAGYRKHDATVILADSVTLSDTFWSGGTRSTYTAVNLATLQAGRASQYAPPQFGGPAQPLTVQIPDGVAIVETGFFCGKVACAYVYMRPVDARPLLPSARVADAITHAVHGLVEREGSPWHNTDDDNPWTDISALALEAMLLDFYTHEEWKRKQAA